MKKPVKTAEQIQEEVELLLEHYNITDFVLICDMPVNNETKALVQLGRCKQYSFMSAIAEANSNTIQEFMSKNNNKKNGKT